MVKHTPGPWFAYGRYIGTKNHKSAIGECRDINGNWSDDCKASADAHLIAAAPDLLDSLKDCLDRLIEAFPELKNYGPIKRGYEAIAKAEGRS